MSETGSWDVVVVGAGVVGLACSAELSSRGLSVLCVEREARAGQGTSSRNSGVVHAGMYYPTGTLKARLCVRGNASMWSYVEAHHVAHARTGKLIVATDVAGEQKLHDLLARARQNGVAELELVPVAFARSLEPNVRCRAALWSPRTGIVDAHALMHALAAQAREGGADFAFHHALAGLERRGAGWALHVIDARGERSTFEAPRVVNAAGLQADEVAALAGIDVDEAGYRQHYVKGNYFRLRRRGLVSRLVYPVPEEGLAGLGVHVTVELDGAAKLGPDVEPLAGRALAYGVDESREESFFRAAATYLEGLAREDLTPDQCGIRPKLARPHVAWTPGEPARDFVIADERARGLPGLVNLLGIESPGLTASLEIAREVADLLR
ncbi:MAG: NAD(P)/FAD-dependent oxidoreductase [Deltaproteobacteria bacterium]|nr:NAD(P)/FAD-dependent oxidoreductase [Deltaproteobacteria bacterium]